MKESLQYLHKNSDSINYTLNQLRNYHKNSDCLYDFTISNLDQLYQDFQEDKELEEYERLLEDQQPYYNIINEIIVEKDKIKHNYNLICTQVQNIEIDTSLLNDLQILVDQKKKIHNEKIQLQNFQEGFQISEKQIEILTSQSSVVDENFFKAYIDLCENLKTRNDIIKKGIVQKFDLTQKLKNTVSQYQIYQKIAIRKITDFYIQNIKQIKYDRKKHQELIILVSENSQQNLDNINELIMSIVNQDFNYYIQQIHLDQENKFGFVEIVQGIEYFLEFINFFSQELSLNLQDLDYFYKKNMNQIFPNFYNLIDFFKIQYVNSSDFEIQNLEIIEGFLVLRQFMLKYRKISIYLNFDKLWSKYQRELFYKLNQQLKNFFQKILQFQGKKNYKFILNDYLTHFDQSKQFYLLNKNKEFREMKKKCFMLIEQHVK